ncbi:TRAP transporter small permease [Leisingera sp. ANG59]|uniref:TRAP transporter small permease n=1 Tax=Leisingera sp. ANG59 TaxID=2675221 RepID=UPI0015747CDC|nr:TRAP transporter small permease [Leisingera sp. ANG59]NSY39353.1 TRAP transporter small permease subunit [Leisingera sp. ANG59]
MFELFSRLTRGLALLSAWIGGLALLATIVLTCISITGRSLSGFGLGPVSGDFEWVEIGIGFAVFCFLPLCHLARSHATVDLFATSYPQWFNRLLDLTADLLMLGFAALITWRTMLGMLDKHLYAETTLIIGFPVWLQYALCLFGAVGLLLTAIYCMVRDIVAWGRTKYV